MQQKDHNKEKSPSLSFKFSENPKTKKKSLEKIAFSDGAVYTPGNSESEEKFKKALRNITGTDSTANAFEIMNHMTRGMLGPEDNRWNEVAALLPALEPQDPTEALVLGQLIALQKAAAVSLERFLKAGTVEASAKFGMLASKLYAQANITLQTLAKYRSKGQQVMQVVHVHNEGQAIVAQTLSTPANGGRELKNCETEPHGS